MMVDEAGQWVWMSSGENAAGSATAFSENGFPARYPLAIAIVSKL